MFVVGLDIFYWCKKHTILLCYEWALKYIKCGVFHPNVMYYNRGFYYSKLSMHSWNKLTLMMDYYFFTRAASVRLKFPAIWFSYRFLP